MRRVQSPAGSCANKLLAPSGDNVNFVQGFPYSSGLWVGDVDGYELVDARLSYDLPLFPGTSLALAATNVFDRRHRQGVATPMIGRLLVLRLTRSF